MTAAGLLAASTISVPNVSYLAIGPEVALIVGALALLGISALSGTRLARGFATGFTVATSLVSLSLSLVLWTKVTGAGHHGYTAIGGAIAVDGFSVLISVLTSIALLLCSLSSESFLKRESMEGPELPVLMMLSASGAILMGAANDLIVVFLGLEILSIALYVLAGSNLRRRQSGEAAIKYFVLGAFSSAIFLYGVALVYGATGSTNLPQIASFLAGALIVHNGVLLAGAGLIIVGLGFKVAVVPFHTWAPDVYQGAPTPTVSFMAAVAKAGGFAGLLRVVFSTFPTLQLDWRPIIWVLAVLSLVVGAVLALVQRDVKRMLAYSSINHAGFVLLGLQAATNRGIAGSLYYLFVYMFMVIGAFSVASVVGAKGDMHHDLDDYRGLIRRNPLLAVTMTVFLLAQAGVPFTTGFLAKFSVVAAVTDAHSYAVAVIAMVSAVVAAFFYLRVVAYMFGPAGVTGAPGASRELAEFAEFAEEPVAVAVAVGSGSTTPGSGSTTPGSGSTTPSGTQSSSASDLASEPGVSVPLGPGVVVVVCAAATVVFGIWAGPILDFARSATLYF